MYLKKWVVCLLSLLLITGCTQKKVELPHPVTIEFYSVKTCAECIAFKKNAIPYLKKRYKNISIKMYDMDDMKTTVHYDQAVNSLKDFDDEFYGLGPFIYVKGYFALLGYETDDEEILAKDIERVANGNKPTQDFSDRRFIVK